MEGSWKQVFAEQGLELAALIHLLHDTISEACVCTNQSQHNRFSHDKSKQEADSFSYKTCIDKLFEMPGLSDIEVLVACKALMRSPERVFFMSMRQSIIDLWLSELTREHHDKGEAYTMEELWEQVFAEQELELATLIHLLHDTISEACVCTNRPQHNRFSHDKSKQEADSFSYKTCIDKLFEMPGLSDIEILVACKALMRSPEERVFFMSMRQSVIDLWLSELMREHHDKIRGGSNK